jgi:hypothetical protein
MTLDRLKSAAVRFGEAAAGSNSKMMELCHKHLVEAAVDYHARNHQLEDPDFSVHRGYVRINDGGSVEVSLDQKPIEQKREYEKNKYKAYGFRMPEGSLFVGQGVFDQLRQFRFGGAVLAEIERVGMGRQTKFTVTGYDADNVAVAMLPPPEDWKWV